LITVTEEAEEILRGYECPEGTGLRLDSVNGYHWYHESSVRVGAGQPQSDDQIIQHLGLASSSTL